MTGDQLSLRAMHCYTEGKRSRGRQPQMDRWCDENEYVPNNGLYTWQTKMTTNWDILIINSSMV